MGVGVAVAMVVGGAVLTGEFVLVAVDSTVGLGVTGVKLVRVAVGEPTDGLVGVVDCGVLAPKGTGVLVAVASAIKGIVGEGISVYVAVPCPRIRATCVATESNAGDSQPA